LKPSTERSAIIGGALITAVATLAAAYIVRPANPPAARPDGERGSVAGHDSNSSEVSAGNSLRGSEPRQARAPTVDASQSGRQPIDRRLDLSGCWTNAEACTLRVSQVGRTYRYRSYCGGEHVTSGEGTIVDGMTSSEGVYQGKRIACSGRVSDDGARISGTCTISGEAEPGTFEAFRMAQCPAESGILR